MFKPLHYAIAVLLLCAVSIPLGIISENDFHRINKTVNNEFFAPAPGKMYEVRDGVGTALCGYSNAQASIVADKRQRKRYANLFGQTVPVSQFVGAVVPALQMRLQVELIMDTYADGLKSDYRASLDAACEKKMEEAYKLRNSVVCVVDNVFRAPDKVSVVAVRFKPFAVTPEAHDNYPACPLKAPVGWLWSVRQQFISVSVLPDD